MAKPKHSAIHRRPAALPVWIAALILAAVLINTADPLAQLGGVACALLVMGGVVCQFAAD